MDRVTKAHGNHPRRYLYAHYSSIGYNNARARLTAGIRLQAHMMSMTRLQQLGVANPIVQPPIAGVATPELAAAVCNAGGTTV